MNLHSLWLVLLFLGWIIWLGMRTVSFVKLLVSKLKQDSRAHILFFVWPLLMFIQVSVLQAWKVPQFAFFWSWVCLVLGLIVDSVYYLLIHTTQSSSRRWQWIGGGFMGILILGFGMSTLRPMKGLALRFPHHGKARVWHQSMLNPTVFYFMKPGTSAQKLAKAFEDPNYGQAIFSPCAGKLLRLEEDGQFLVIAPDQASSGHLRIGPFLPESLQVKPGSTVFLGQPLGLQGQTLDIPGIQLQLSGIGDFHFTNYLAGQRWARKLEAGMPKRNQIVSSISAFSFHPVSEEN